MNPQPSLESSRLLAPLILLEMEKQPVNIAIGC